MGGGHIDEEEEEPEEQNVGEREEEEWRRRRRRRKMEALSFGVEVKSKEERRNQGGMHGKKKENGKPRIEELVNPTAAE